MPDFSLSLMFGAPMAPIRGMHRPIQSEDVGLCASARKGRFAPRLSGPDKRKAE